MKNYLEFEKEIKNLETELSNLKDKGLVSLKGDLMKELRRRTELMEVITESPKDDSQDKQP